MKAQRGYFGLVQYCPNPSNLEVANLGVLLLCPDSGFLDVMMGNNDRVKKFFGKDSFNKWALENAKAALIHRLRKDKEKLCDLERLTTFIESRGNDVIISKLRPMRVQKNPNVELKELFDEFFNAPKAVSKPRSKIVFPALDSVFKRLNAEGKADLNVEVKVPKIDITIKAPYAFENGAIHLVKPEKFSVKEQTATNTATSLAVQGDLLQKYPTKDGPAHKLIVVADFDPSVKADVKNVVERLLHAYNVRTVFSEDLPNFIEQIEKEVH